MAWEPDYVTTAEVKSYLRITDDDDNALIGIWATTASRAVDTFCHRQFGSVDVVEDRTYHTAWDRLIGSWTTEIDDLQSVVALEVADGVGTLLADYELGPTNAEQKGKPFTRIITSTPGPLVISGLWGWAEVPAAVKNATLIQAARFAARRDSPFGMAGSPSEGTEQRLLATLDPDLKTALGSKYRREWWAA